MDWDPFLFLPHSGYIGAELCCILQPPPLLPSWPRKIWDWNFLSVGFTRINCREGNERESQMGGRKEERRKVRPSSASKGKGGGLEGSVTQ